MSREGRVFGLETEYGFSFRPAAGSSAPQREEIFAALCEAVDARCPSLPEPPERRFIRFLANGAKFYYDTGLLEWSTPECRSLRDVIACDKAGERIIAEAMGDAERALSRRGYVGQLFVAKNNVDAQHNTYGCHENYLLVRSPDLLDNQSDFLKLIVRQLVPFLVTRQILCGAGKVAPYLHMLRRTMGYHVSQRAEFITEVVSSETRGDRGIVNMREEALSDSARFRRLHLILGDANLSEYATFLKLGTTAIVLSMIEDHYISDDLALADPRLAINQISYDPTCRRSVELRNGTTATAIDIQSRYLELAEAYFDREPLEVETENVLYEWGHTLEALKRDPEELSGRIDWVIKLPLLRQRAEQVGQGDKWQLTPGDHWGHPAIRELDLKYHVLRPGQSLFPVLERAGLVDRVVFPEEIERAKQFPPFDTRAKIRADSIRGAIRARSLAAVDWEQVIFPGAIINLSDPREFFHPEVQVQIRDPLAVGFLLQRLADPIPDVRRRAALSLGATGSLEAREPLLSRLQDQVEEVRAAAAWALGELGDTRSVALLQRLLRDPCFRVRREVARALSRMGDGKGDTTWP